MSLKKDAISHKGHRFHPGKSMRWLKKQTAKLSRRMWARYGEHVPTRCVTGDIDWRQFGGCWVSKKCNNGEFDFWFVLELINMHDATGDDAGDKYCVSLSAVAPSQVGKEEMQSALRSCGWEGMDDGHPIQLVEVLHHYGTKAHLLERYGNNAYALLREVRKEATVANMMFGFYMDRPQNGIGSTGWDLIKGDLLAGLRKTA